MNFEFIYNHAPDVLQSKFTRLRQLRERPDYHPEESAAKHIEIVTNRCIVSNNPNLILTGFLHDICKAETAKPNPKNGFPMCPGHDFEAAKLIRTNPDVQNFIRTFRGNVDIVEWLVAQHMRIAQLGVMKKSKQDAMRNHEWFPLLEAFHCCDDMLVTDQEAVTQMFDILTGHRQINFDK